MVLRMHRACTGVVLFCAYIAHARLAHAEMLYVGGAGANDDNPGSAAAPFATLARAAAEVQPGDIVSVRAGSYPGFDIYTAGAPNARIVFQAEAAASPRPVVNGRINISASNITLRGFDVTGSDMMGVNVYGGSQLELVDNVIHHNQRGGIYAAPAEGRSSDDILMQGNVVYRNSLDNSARVISGGWAGAIQMMNANRLTIADNHVYENWGEGISLTVTDSSVARGNEVHDNYGVELYMDHATNALVESNLLYTTEKTEFFRNLNGSWPAGGIQLSNEPGYGNVPSARGNRVINNIVIGGRFGFFYWRAPEDNAGLQELLVANNTFYGPKEVLVKIDEGPHSSARFINNLFVAAGSEIAWVEGGGLDFRHNVWTGGQARGPQDLTVDCGLLQPGSNEAADYRIGSMASACVGAGTALPEVTKDFFGGSRAGRTDVGAHQFGSVVPNPGTGGAGGMPGQGGTGGGSAPSGGKSGFSTGGSATSGAAAVAGSTMTVAGTAGTTADDPDGRDTAPVGCACSAPGSRAGWTGWTLAAAALSISLGARRRRARSD